MVPKLYGERINQVVNFLTERGTETRLVKQLLRAVYQSNMNSFAQMVELPLTVRQALIGKFGETVSSLTPDASHAADSAHKILFLVTIRAESSLCHWHSGGTLHSAYLHNLDVRLDALSAKPGRSD